MTLKVTVALVAASIIVAASPAHARRYHQSLSSPVSDALLPGERFVSGVNQAFDPSSRLQERRRGAFSGSRGYRTSRRGPKAHPGASSGHRLVARSGATASVSSAALPHFQCLLDKLEGVGYRIDFMGGYASRGNASAHPTGNALDVNQTGRNRVTRPLPAGASAMAEACGLTHGGTWARRPDTGHFEMAHGYGYVGGRHYASRHHRGHVAVAEALPPRQGSSW